LVKADPASLINYSLPFIFSTTAMQIHIPVHDHTTAEAIYPFDARGIAKRFRHAAIFGALDALNAGERMRFVNDHNPIPLLQQMQARYGERVEINYLEQSEQQVVIDFIVKAA
jgi:uncharacterized protein (DUF2249 family)